jgi:hypothetical protein
LVFENIYKHVCNLLYGNRLPYAPTYVGKRRQTR